MAAESEPVIVHPQPQNQLIAPQFDEQVREQLAALLCGPGTDPADCEAVDTGGYKVVTTLDTTMQASAEKWLKAYIVAPNLGSKQATINYLAQMGITAQSDSFDYYRIVGPQPTTGVATGLRNANIHNGALIAIDYRTGEVLAYAGSAGFYDQTVPDPAKPGQDLFDPQFDVLSNGYRQPGSSFKPINYIVGLQDETMTAASLFMDVATNFGGGYTPHDADNYERGPVRMREALQYSLNIPAVKAASINGVDHLMQRAEDFGLTFPPNSNPGVSIGIGTLDVHPADLVSAYGAIADGGNPRPALDDPLRHGREGQRHLVVQEQPADRDASNHATGRLRHDGHAEGQHRSEPEQLVEPVQAGGQRQARRRPQDRHLRPGPGSVRGRLRGPAHRSELRRPSSQGCGRATATTRPARA